VRWFLLLLLAGSLGCRARTVAVRVSIPALDGAETPLPDLIVTFLPYDRDLLLADLEKQAGPRPRAAELDSLFALFRTPFAVYIRLSDQVSRIRLARDSVARLRGPTDPATVAFADSADRLSARAIAARAALDRTRNAIWPTITKYREETRQWETAAFKDYSTRVKSQSSRIFANPVSDTTDAAGWTTVTLTDGTWWATAHSIDPIDPNAEWYWNVRIERDTVSLSPRTGRHRPRY
jgi:hypothetical protein